MSDLREALDAAFDSNAEAPPEPTPAPEPVLEQTSGSPEAGPSPSEPEAQETAPGRVRGPDGRFVKSDEPVPPTTEEKKDPKAPTAQAAPPATQPATEKPAAQPPAATTKAPQSWRPAAREEWTKIPPSIQAEVTRREREVQQALQESSEARQGYQKFREAVGPFEQMIRAEGGEPLAAVQGLLQTAYALRHAPEPVKVDMIARMIQAYIPGTSALQALDARLAGAAPQQGQPQQAPQQFRDPRVDEIMAERQRERAALQQQEVATAQAQIAEVEGREFFADLRNDMADIMEVSLRRGLRLTVAQAYDKAAALHPEISKVLEQRAAAQRLANPTGSTQAARRASVSPRSNPAVPPSGERKAGDLRADLEAAMEAAGRT